MSDKSQYAIAFSFDIERLAAAYPDTHYKNAYERVRRVLNRHGFTHRHGTVYFGESGVVTADTCATAIQAVVQQYPWFTAGVASLFMLRIEETTDLMPLLQRGH